MNAYSSSNPYRVSAWFIAMSFAITFFIDLIAWPKEYFFWVPEFSLLMLIYWVLHRPDSVNLGIAFCLGLVMDFALLSPLGQHAISYSIIVFLVGQQQRQLLLYHFGFQAIAVAALFFLHAAIMSVTRLFYDQTFYGWTYFTPAITIALIWPLFNTLMVNIMHWRQNRR